MKHFQRIFLLFAAGMLIFSPAAAGDVNAAGDPSDAFSAVHHKLSGPLRDAVLIYRTEGKLTKENLAARTREKMNRVRAIKGEGPLDPSWSVPDLPEKKTDEKKTGPRGQIISGTSSITLPESRPVIMDMLVNKVIQDRWGNPPYDVIECNIDMAGEISVLNRFNLKVRAVSEFEGKTIVSAEIASYEIENVAGLDQVIRIAPVVKKTINNDLASEAVKVSRIRLKTGANYTKGYTGEGVVVGIIDSGIDWTHEDFVDPVTGGTRIRYIWDTEVDTPGRFPSDVFGGALSGLNYGTVWTAAEIDGGSCTSVDTNGHGTHVSGSAAGNGYATGKYTGIAPNADIIFVKGLDNNGILFIYDVSSQLGMPCSINMSYGPGDPINYISYWPLDWPADETDLDAIEIAGWNAAYGGGHIPVKSAGNEGHWNTYTDLTGGTYPYKNGSYHAEGHLSGGTNTHVLTVPDYTTVWPFYFTGVTPTYFPVVIFGYWSDAPIRITFTSPDGRVIGPVVHGNDGFTFPPSGSEVLYYYMDNPPAANGDHYGALELYSYDSPYQPTIGGWTVTVEAVGGGAVNYDIWCGDLVSYAFWGDKGSFFTGNYTHANYILDEGASPYEISVGSFTTRDGWEGLDGGSWTYAMRPMIGHISPFSSPGPSRDRRTKPDIAAPGEIILSAASSFRPWPTSDLDPDGRHAQMSGTSMAAPMTTGAVALILQKHPGSTVNDVRRMLNYWALNDAQTRTAGANAFGAGKLNVIRLNEDGVAVLTQNRTEVILDNADKTVLFDGSASYDPEGFPISYLWTIEDKPEGANPELIVSNDRATLNADPLVEGMYRISLAINDSVWDGPKTYSSWITAKFLPVLPPSGVSLQRVANDLIFVNEYINRIRWTANPENKLEILNYRVYRKVKGNGDDTYALIAELSPSMMGYDDRGLGKDEYYTYRITTVSVNGKESDPAVVSN